MVIEAMNQMALTAELVAQCHREVSRGLPRTDVRRPEPEEYAALVERLDAEAGTSLWVFAYGSLIWKPGFTPRNVDQGRVLGWHRKFCLWMRDFRGTPDRPGLMMGLARGGSARGLLLGVADAERRTILDELLRRELPYAEFLHMTRWIRVSTTANEVRALTFWAGRLHSDDPLNMPEEEAARIIADACGWGGSCAEYLYNTVLNLEAHGFRDSYLWRLQALVAQEIEQRRRSSAARC